ncbi:MAG: 3-hydroxyacyl-CoA dehydrogenase NAD-binding domain-containing protein [Flavobacteriales bacterium]|nr:3-hydroxyacyl-CoA dehydrogenase NAD-binding domain-containing protein [Flavobacteriales bacterium]MCW8912430.1 3-hydroxyacyl-CoA dehydrogenase NAD-binding domain-containing protein [Flavobacteriales bacterium]MCW8936514.1 3-hydroxyacyl-CoA dehydrogenase NAD-binding domain-containing protein [Flavobacteriales bacterium]MCW8969583.1 3-hydroxyacyl-CoA dehydrogenase NAD-binding domain-containing protein [Flavobacteriales bacterium]MCW8989569.1 3-hydroxyacyl-CoA dehydrogenase NAD-binding domain-c
MNEINKVGVLGAGSMGSGIVQIAATNKHQVTLVDLNEEALVKASTGLKNILSRLVQKEKIDQATADNIMGRIKFSTSTKDLAECDLIIEAIIENLEVKKKVFAQLESITSPNCILASNTSSLSIASIAAACKKPERVIGIHFFNPAPLMPLVEIIPAVQTSEATKTTARALIDNWGKVTVLAKDTPGFIVNRVARPFYGEALRIYEEGVADFATIDWAMTEIGGFRMGPFTLMDYIGNDINYTVTETVFEAFYYDPRYKPSFTQKRHSEAGWYGRKSGRGYYNYADEANMPNPKKDKALGTIIFNRILVMLINEAIDALFLNIASKEDIDLAMTKGVNYPKGLLKWADEIGLKNVLQQLETLFNEYGEDRYRPSVLLRRMVRENKNFF